MKKPTIIHRCTVLLLPVILFLVSVAALPAFAQQSAPPNNQANKPKSQTTTPAASPQQPAEKTQTPAPPALPDLEIIANITARELIFEVVPDPKVEFTGQPDRITVWEADRQNLPRPVRPGVVYRNIGIQLKITSTLADIERIVAEALGEIPPQEAAPPKEQKPEQQSEQTQAPAATKLTAAPAAKNQKNQARPRKGGNNR